MIIILQERYPTHYKSEAQQSYENREVERKSMNYRNGCQKLNAFFVCIMKKGNEGYGKLWNWGYRKKHLSYRILNEYFLNSKNGINNFRIKLIKKRIRSLENDRKNVQIYLLCFKVLL